MSELCMGCMNPLPEGSRVCPVCGFPVDEQNPSPGLPLKTVLQEHYTLGRLMREGSSSLLYLGYDNLIKEPCFIQEFYPGTLSQRNADGSVRAMGGCERAFADLLATFRDSMRSLAKVRDLSAMIPVYDIFEENGTVYAVSDYYAGVTLTKKIKQAGGRLSWADARPLFMSLLSSVSQLHSVHIRHLAICPDNILIGQDGKAHLRNFDIIETRRAGNDLKPELATGFAAPEQYDATGAVPLTDATDVYGLAATLFYTVTGNVPPAGNRRAADSDDLFMSKDAADELGTEGCGALFNALQVGQEQRTGSVAELRDQLSVEPNVSALRHEVAAEEQEDTDSNGKRSHSWLIIAATAIAALLLVLLLVVALPRLLHGGKDNESTLSGNALPTISTKAKPTEKPEETYAVEDLTGQNYYDLRYKKFDGNLTLAVRHLEYSDKKAGTILAQEPKSGTVVGKEATISVVISCGKTEKVKVPNVAGWNSEHAKLYLEAVGFRVETAKLQVSDYDKGLVDSTDPVAGTEMQLGDVITLRVSDVEQSEPPADTEPSDTDLITPVGNN